MLAVVGQKHRRRGQRCETDVRKGLTDASCEVLRALGQGLCADEEEGYVNRAVTGNGLSMSRGASVCLPVKQSSHSMHLFKETEPSLSLMTKRSSPDFLSTTVYSVGLSRRRFRSSLLTRKFVGQTKERSQKASSVDCGT